jgi:pimeloyl-ACP methyl ester carboxylesterase
VNGPTEFVVSADGTPIAFRTAGVGPPLLLVHGGMTSGARWGPLRNALVDRYEVTSMDRRGRPSSGDGPDYALAREYEDVDAVAGYLAARQSSAIDVFGHSYGAICALGAAGIGAPLRRIALYEPPGPETVPAQWVERVTAMVAEGKPGRAMVTFLTEVVGLTQDQVTELRDAAPVEDVLAIVSRTMAREADALSTLDLAQLAAAVNQPVRLMLGATSPPWAGAVTTALTQQLRSADAVVLTDLGHEAVDIAPALVAAELDSFFRDQVNGVMEPNS